MINFAGHFKQMQWRAILESVINIVISIVLVMKIGIYGVVIGTIAASLYRANDIILYANKHILNRSSWNTYKLWLSNMLVFCLTAFGFRFVDLPVETIAGFFLAAVPVSLIVCSVYFISVCLLDRETAAYLLRVGKTIVRRLAK